MGKIRQILPKPGTKLAPSRALRNHAVRDFSEGARLPRWLDPSVKSVSVRASVRKKSDVLALALFYVGPAGPLFIILVFT